MRLIAYLEQKGMSGSDFARQLGVDDATVNRWLPGVGKKQVRKPGWDMLERISQVTDGAVTANDFMDQPADDAAPTNGRAA